MNVDVPPDAVLTWVETDEANPSTCILHFNCPVIAAELDANYFDFDGGATLANFIQQTDRTVQAEADAQVNAGTRVIFFGTNSRAWGPNPTSGKSCISALTTPPP